MRETIDRSIQPDSESTCPIEPVLFRERIRDCSPRPLKLSMTAAAPIAIDTPSAKIKSFRPRSDLNGIDGYAILQN